MPDERVMSLADAGGFTLGILSANQMTRLIISSIDKESHTLKVSDHEVFVVTIIHKNRLAYRTYP